MFKLPKATPQCLSRWQISQLTLMEEANRPIALARHLNSCANCAALLKEERELVLSQQQVSLPAFLQEKLHAGLQNPLHTATLSTKGPSKQRSQATGTWWRWRPVWALGMVASGAFAALLLLSPNVPTSTERSKGATELHLSVMRSEKIIADDVLISEAPTLQQGDRLRIRVLSTMRWGSLWTKAGATWDKPFEGNLPVDGWLPVGFRYHHSARTHLRLILCAVAPEAKKVATADGKPRGCERADFEL